MTTRLEKQKKTKVILRSIGMFGWLGLCGFLVINHGACSSGQIPSSSDADQNHLSESSKESTHMQHEDAAPVTERPTDQQNLSERDQEATPGLEQKVQDMDPPKNTGQWESGQPLPTPMQEVSVVALQGEIYVVGGINGSLQTSADVWIYNPNQKQWRKIEVMPKSLHHANAVVFAEKLYVIGGLDTTFREMGDIFVYDPKTKRWETKKSMPSGRTRGASVLGVMQNKIYIAGGLRRRAVIDFDAYDPNTESWEKKADLPAPLDHLAGGIIEDKFYIAGGRDTNITALHAKSYVYQPNTDVWSEIAPMPTPRGGVAATVYRGKLYVFGGEGNPAPKTNGVFAQVEVYDPLTKQWQSLKPMAFPVHGTGAASLDDRIYIPGGASRQAFGAIPDLSVFFPDR